MCNPCLLGLQLYVTSLALVVVCVVLVGSRDSFLSDVLFLVVEFNCLLGGCFLQCWIVRIVVVVYLVCACVCRVVIMEFMSMWCGLHVCV